MDDKDLGVLLKDAFHSVKCEEPLKEKTLDIILDGRLEMVRHVEQKSPMFSPARKWMAVCACMLIAIGVSLGIYSVPAAAICLEGDMSMRVLVNRFDKVIDVTAYNSNARETLAKLKDEAIKYSGRDFVKDVINVSQAQGVEVYIISDNERLSSSIMADLSTGEKIYDEREDVGESNDVCNIHNTTNMTCQVVSSNVNEDKNIDSDKNNMTYQRYEIWEKVRALGVDLSKDQVRNMKLSDLRDIIAKAEIDANNGTNNDCFNGTGSIDGGYKGDNPSEDQLDNPSENELQNPSENELENPLGDELENPSGDELENPSNDELNNPSEDKLDNPLENQLENEGCLDCDVPTDFDQINGYDIDNIK